MANGPIAHGLWVLHKCDNPPCVNPTHLFLGDAPANSADMVAKGRAFRPQGELHPAAKLTEADVRDIREQSSRGVAKTKIAQMYKLSLGHVYNIINRSEWPHVA